MNATSEVNPYTGTPASSSAMSPAQRLRYAHVTASTDIKTIYDADLVLTPDAEMVRTKLALFTEILREIVGVARERDVPLQFVVVPSAVDACPGFGIRVDPERYPDYSPDRLTATIVGAVRAAGGAARDLTPALQAEDGRNWVGGTDIHWNSGGQAVSAGAAAEALWAREDMRRALRAR